MVLRILSYLKARGMESVWILEGLRFPQFLRASATLGHTVLLLNLWLRRCATSRSPGAVCGPRTAVRRRAVVSKRQEANTAGWMEMSAELVAHRIWEV